MMAHIVSKRPRRWGTRAAHLDRAVEMAVFFGLLDELMRELHHAPRNLGVGLPLLLTSTGESALLIKRRRVSEPT